MKTTIEIPEKLLKQSKLLAATRGETLKALIIEALERVLHEATSRTESSPEWMRFFGSFRESPDETRSIQNRIDKEFSIIDTKDWR